MKFIFGLGLFILLILLWSLALALPVYFLWNWVGVSVFGLPVLTWAESWGILLLIGFLFGRPVSKP